MLKAYKTSTSLRALRVKLVSDYLDDNTLEDYRKKLDCLTIAPEMYITVFRATSYPIINIDEYFLYIELMGIDISEFSSELQDSFAVLIDILKDKYGIEYVDAEG